MLHLEDDEVHGRIQNEVERQMDNIGSHIKHDLILAVTNEGYAERVMNAAKPAGATGGTILLARRVGAEDAVRFFGIELHAEKEIVAMLVSRDKKREIMESVNSACGIKTEARGFVFSMPVDAVMGLGE